MTTLPAIRFRYLLLQLEREGLTQKEIAQRLGLDASFINDHCALSHRPKDVSASVIHAAAKHLRLKPSFFFDDRVGGDAEPDYRDWLIEG